MSQITFAILVYFELYRSNPFMPNVSMYTKEVVIDALRDVAKAGGIYATMLGLAWVAIGLV